VVAVLLRGTFSIKLGCLLISLLVGFRNWADADISLPILDRGRKPV
jgi:hypothetical protein